jgi:2-haloacid dehalogenase
VAAVPRWATFDCYGTLIDWNGGLRRALAGLWPSEDADELLERYHALEREIEHDQPALSYREVMTEATRRIAAARGLEPAEPSTVADSLPSWEPFPEVPGSLAQLRERGWRLAALSNTDPDLIATSLARIGVPFDEIVTARDAGSYKPAHGHWRVFFERTGAAGDEHVHVAASLFHDIAPAGELGLTSVWINRLGERPGPEPTRELPDLTRLPDTLDELVP